MIDWTERARYETDNGVSLARLPILLLGPIVPTVVVAWLLKTTFLSGWYFLVIVPACAGFILGGILYLLVGASHCRNAWLAGALGALVGSVAFLGYYHLCMVDLMPDEEFWRVDLLPAYIHARLESDVAEDVARPMRNRRNQPSFYLNTFGFFMDFGFVAVVSAVLAWKRARKAYYPPLARWMMDENAVLPPQTYGRLARAFATGGLAEFAATITPGGNAQSGCLLNLEYVGPRSTLEAPIYLTVQDHPESRSFFTPRGSRTTFLRQVQLETDEALALRRLFPRFDSFLKDQAGVESDGSPTFEVLTEAPGRLTSRAKVVEILPVPEPYRQVVRTKSYPWLVNLIGAVTLIFLLVGLGLLIAGIVLILRGEVLPSMMAILVGGVSLAFAIYVGVFAPFAPEGMWIERRMRRKLGDRPDALVDADDPKSVCVSLIPRAHFTKIMMTMATDLLLLGIDRRQRRLLLEGDCDRYRIPADAIHECKPERFYHPLDKACQTELWMVRLGLEGEDGDFEMLLGCFHGDLWPMTNERRRDAARELCRRINRLRE